MAGTTVLRGTFRADRLESVNPLEFVGLSQFEEMRVAERRRLIDLKSVYGLSNLRDITTTTGSGAVANTVGGGEFTLSTTASGTDSVILESAERGRYVAGGPSEAGIGVRVSATPTGNQVARWGYYDGQDGFGFGVDADGIFVFTRKAGTDTVVRQADWNNDTLRGTGGAANPSRLSLDLSTGNVFQVVFTYYGYGACYFEVLIDDSDGRQRKIIVHRYNATSGLVVDDPNLPIRAEVDNDGTATAFNGLHIGGRQYSTIGDYSPNRRVTGSRRLALASVGTTVLPLVTFRRKSAYQSVSVKVEGFDIITDADLVLELRLGATLTGASYGTPTNHTATETALETDTSATAITGGDVIFSMLVDASGAGGNASGSGSVQQLGFDFAALQPVTLCARAISGTATVSALLRAREEW